MKYSILIPVYNTSKYLRQCLDSVLAQDYTDFEIILVNDGSTDSSPSICEEYSKKDSRIKYYSKANSGLLLTRRYSLPLSSGEYILFLDSDDYWDLNTLSTIDNIISNNPNLDMVLYRFRRMTDGAELKSEDVGLFEDGTIFNVSNKTILLEKFFASSRLNTIWSKCIKRDKIDIDADYSQFKDKKGEDLLQSITLMLVCENIYYCDKALANYRLSDNGRGRNFKIKYLYDYDVVRNYVLIKLKDNNVADSVFAAFCDYYFFALQKMFVDAVSLDISYSNYMSIIKDIQAFESFKKASLIVEKQKLKVSKKIWIYSNIQNSTYKLMFIRIVLLIAQKKTKNTLKRVLKYD